MSFYYVVANIDGKRYFIDKYLDITDDFDAVRQFQSKDDAEEFVEKHYPETDTAILLFS